MDRRVGHAWNFDVLEPRKIHPIVGIVDADTPAEDDGARLLCPVVLCPSGNDMVSVTTWRCHPKIAEFSDTIFDASWQFPKTASKNEQTTDHDGIFLVRREHVDAYVDRYRPQCLRHSVSSAKDLPLDFMNFKVSKGATFPRVLIAPTTKISDFISKGTALEPMAASTFYVAVTRSQQSVAIVLEKPGVSLLPYWVP